MPSAAKRFFLDANILFSAAYSAEGRSAALFALARRRLCRLVTSHYAIQEAQRNLSDKKPGALKSLTPLLNWVKVVREANIAERERVAAIGLDAMDAPILAAAIGAADVLVTGDHKHFGRWMGKDIFGVRVSSLADALDFVLRDSRAH